MIVEITYIDNTIKTYKCKAVRYINDLIALLFSNSKSKEISFNDIRKLTINKEVIY